MVRFNNKISEAALGGKLHWPCLGNRRGRPISQHLHGSASLAPYDGWADDVTCTGTPPLPDTLQIVPVVCAATCLSCDQGKSDVCTSLARLCNPPFHPHTHMLALISTISNFLPLPPVSCLPSVPPIQARARTTYTQTRCVAGCLGAGCLSCSMPSREDSG
jgi:hypothetical protein